MSSTRRLPETGDIVVCWMPDGDIPKRAAIVITDPDPEGLFYAIMFSTAYAKEGGTQKIALHLDTYGRSWDFKKCRCER